MGFFHFVVCHGRSDIRQGERGRRGWAPWTVQHNTNALVFFIDIYSQTSFVFFVETVPGQYLKSGGLLLIVRHDIPTAPPERTNKLAEIKQRGCAIIIRYFIYVPSPSVFG